jgi:hypothetical protein
MMQMLRGTLFFKLSVPQTVLYRTRLFLPEHVYFGPSTQGTLAMLNFCIYIPAHSSVNNIHTDRPGQRVLVSHGI